MHNQVGLLDRIWGKIVHVEALRIEPISIRKLIFHHFSNRGSPICTRQINYPAWRRFRGEIIWGTGFCQCSCKALSLVAWSYAYQAVPVDSEYYGGLIRWPCSGPSGCHKALVSHENLQRTTARNVYFLSIKKKSETESLGLSPCFCQHVVSRAESIARKKDRAT